MSDKNSKRKEKVNPMIHQGESGSLFGFSVAAHKDQGRGWWATILTSIETFGFFHQHHWWVGFNIFKNKEIISWWSRSVFKRHTYFTSYLASQGSKLELCIKNRKQSGTQWLAKRMWIGPKSKKTQERKNVERCKAVLEDERYCQRHLPSFCPQHPWQLMLYRVLQVWVNIEKVKTGRLQKNYANWAKISSWMQIF